MVATMGLSTVANPMSLTFSKLPNPPLPSSHSHLLHTHNLTPALPLTPSATATAPLFSRSISSRNVLRRASTSEETSSGTNSFFDDKRDGALVVDDAKPEFKSSFNETEDNEKELPVEEQGLSFDFLDKLNLKFDTDDTGSLVVYGGGAIVAVWLTSAIIGAIDSIPLIPKLLEVVGLGYTVWFTSRYLLFKRNRDELVAKIEELKEQVLGSEDK